MLSREGKPTGTNHTQVQCSWGDGLVWDYVESGQWALLFRRKCHGLLLSQNVGPVSLAPNPLPRSLLSRDGVPGHYANVVSEWLDDKFPGRWLGRLGPIVTSSFSRLNAV